MSAIAIRLMGVVAILCILAGAAASQVTSKPGPIPWRKLYRPLRIPRIPPGSSCPTSEPDRRGDLSRLGFVGTAWGRGPAYPGGLGNDRPALRFLYPAPPTSEFYGSEWSGNKVLWIIDPRRRGRVLIRGRQLDGPNELRFERGKLPPKEMRIGRWGSSPSGAGHRPSYTRVRAAGCYAYQVDGKAFSRVIVFEARADSG
jgi:hypothetical protein